MTGTWSKDADGRLRTVWRFVIFLVGWVIAHSLFTFAAIALLHSVLPEGLGRSPESVMLWTWAAMTPFAAAASVMTVFGCRLFLDRRDVWSLGLTRPARRVSASPFSGLAVGAGAAAAPAIALLALGQLKYEGVRFSATPAAMTLVFLLAAFQEEMVFRGYLLQNMRDVGQTGAGVLVSAALFAMAHGLSPAVWTSPLNMAQLFLSGVLLALGYVLSGNLWFPTALHFGWNWCQGALFGLPVSGIPTPGVVKLTPAQAADEFLTGGRFGLEGSVLALGSVMAAIALLRVALCRRRSAERAKQGPDAPQTPP